MSAEAIKPNRCDKITLTHEIATLLVLAHDLSDAAIHRRVRMLHMGGAVLTIAGFRRALQPIPEVEKCPAINFGRTHNRGFVRRIFAVLTVLVTIRRYQSAFAAADVVIARNLEMLAIGVWGRAFADRRPLLVYECLDIHRLMLGRGVVSRALRWLEGWLSRSASVLIVSSPAFVDNYFERLSCVRLPIKLIENKVLIGEIQRPIPRASAPAWIIGWFGILRCRKSLLMLAALVKQSQGTVRVVIRGKPALDQIPDFHEIVARTDGLDFGGPYQNPQDLPDLYNKIHFIWAIDMYEEGANSSWLLPNRLYEGGLFAAVPIAFAHVETGAFLRQRGLGVLIEQPIDDLSLFFRTLTTDCYHRLFDAMLNEPRETWVCTHEECRALVDSLIKMSNENLHV